MITKASLRRRIVLPFVVLVLFVGVVGTAVLSAQVGGATVGEFDNGLVRSSLRTNDRIAVLENERLQQLRAAANTAGVNNAVKAGNASAAGRLLGPIVGNAQPDHLTLRVLTLGGQTLVSLRRAGSLVESFSDGTNFAAQTAVQHALYREHDALGDKYVFLVTDGSQPMLYWAAPVRTETAARTVVGAVLLGESLAEITQAIRGSASADVTFHDQSGKVLTSSLSASPGLTSDVMLRVTPNSQVRIVDSRSDHEYRQLVSHWTMRGTTLGYVVVGVNADELEDSLMAVRLVLVLLFGAAALAAIVVGIALADRITRPIEQLVASMRVVSAGDYSRRVPIGDADEIGYLARSFNDMSAALQTQIRGREEAYFRNLEALARAIDARDPYTFEHSARVAAISEMLATEMGLPAADLLVLRRSGLLHDVGKIGIPDRILSKTAPLTDEEWASIKRHPVIGYDMLKDVPFLQASLDSIRHHHERWDGEGYPDRLKAEGISPLARIVAVADAFDAMTSDRPYRKGFSFEFAARTIVSESGRQFDPAVVAVFKAKQDALFARLEEMGKKPVPHASDIRLDAVA